MIWLRPPEVGGPAASSAGALDPALLDTAIFDVDGVLIETSRSFLQAVIHATDYLARVGRGLRGGPAPLVTLEDIERFKLAGGWNSDWDCTLLFTALWTARLREWRGQPEAQVSLADWAERARRAAQAGEGGVTWLRTVLPPTALPSEDEARWAHDEFYWGADLVYSLFGHTPVYAPDAPGFVHTETLLLPKDTLPRLIQQGIARFGLITGREGPEVTWALRQLSGLYDEAPTLGLAWYEGAFGRSLFGAVVAASEYKKPDPRALLSALRQLGGRGALFVGDTADDLDLVLRYRREMAQGQAAAPAVLAVAVASGWAARVFQARGADILLDTVGELPDALDRWRLLVRGA